MRRGQRTIVLDENFAIKDTSRRMDDVTQPPALTPFWHSFMRGTQTLPLVPAAILLSGMVGFGAFAHEAGLGLLQAVGISAVVWALPGQVMLVDQLGRGAGWAAIFLAVTLTAVRLLPMTVVLAPLFRGAHLPGPVRGVATVIATHFVALTLWVEGQRVLPTLALPERLPVFLGWCAVFFVLTPLATGFGYLLANAVPIKVLAVLLFLTPLYFGLSMVAAVRASRLDGVIIGVGAVLGPIFHIWIPGLDLLAVGAVAAGIFGAAQLFANHGQRS
jgi:predicted branched-subunit amino acid permease